MSFDVKPIMFIWTARWFSFNKNRGPFWAIYISEEQDLSKAKRMSGGFMRYELTLDKFYLILERMNRQFDVIVVEHPNTHERPDLEPEDRQNVYK
jgi:hypothetical protein